MRESVQAHRFTPADQVVKGEETAIKTISRKLGKDVLFDNTLDTVYGSLLVSAIFKNGSTDEQLDYYSVGMLTEQLMRYFLKMQVLLQVSGLMILKQTKQVLYGEIEKTVLSG